MKIAYKIYGCLLEEKKYLIMYPGYTNVQPTSCPDFETESEAESWLKDELKKKQMTDNSGDYRIYYFIQKTYIKQ